MSGSLPGQTFFYGWGLSMDGQRLKHDLERVLFTREQIAHRVTQLARILTRRFGTLRPVLVCVLKGACFFYVDLCRSMDCAIDMDFISVSSYGLSARSTGVVRLNRDLDQPISGRHVILVEDIIDSGRTLEYLKALFAARKPASVTTVALLEKQGCHSARSAADLYGFPIGGEFVVGYGLDYANQYRNLPYLAVLKPERYTSGAADSTQERNPQHEA